MSFCKKCARESLAAQYRKSATPQVPKLLRSQPMRVIELSKLRATQITVGMHQVEWKQDKIRELRNKPAELIEYLLKHPIRVVLGPGGNAYVIDHHHLGLALLREGYETVPMVVEADFSGLPKDRFWKKMEKLDLVHPYDENGKKRPIGAIPGKLTDLIDDPYRSLAGFAREAGAFKKVNTPFVEFEWADYFRTRIAKEFVTHHFHKAIDMVVELAHKSDAKKLPGFKPGRYICK